jgi:hypothetical protein
VDNLIKDHHHFEDVPPLRKGCLSRSYHMAHDQIKHEIRVKFESKFDKADQPILLDSLYVNNHRQQNVVNKIMPKRVQFSGMKHG